MEYVVVQDLLVIYISKHSKQMNYSMIKEFLPSQKYENRSIKETKLSNFIKILNLTNIFVEWSILNFKKIDNKTDIHMQNDVVQYMHYKAMDANPIYKSLSDWVTKTSWTGDKYVNLQQLWVYNTFNTRLLAENKSCWLIFDSNSVQAISQLAKFINGWKIS